MTARVFDGELDVHYAQAYLMQGEPELPGRWHEGQNNGLCGVAEPGLMFLITGLHTGSVGFTLDILDTEPAMDDSWEEIVEATYVVDESGEPVRLCQWSEDGWPLPLVPGTYRARYCAKGMDRAHEADTILEGEPIIDTYHLTLWPAPWAEDAVIKQMSAIAAYWHEQACRIRA